MNADRNRTITVRAMDTEQQYFVYVGGNVVYSGADPVQAIRRADQEMGIVVDNSARYIWKRGKHIYVSALQNLQTGSLDQSADDSSQCVSAMLNFENENVDDLVRVLKKCLETRYEILRNNVNEFVENKYSLQHIMNLYKEMFNKVLN